MAPRYTKEELAQRANARAERAIERVKEMRDVILPRMFRSIERRVNTLKSLTPEKKARLLEYMKLYDRLSTKYGYVHPL